MHNRQGLSFGMFWECLADWHMWPIYLIGLSWLLPNNPVTGLYSPLKILIYGVDYKSLSYPQYPSIGLQHFRDQLIDHPSLCPLHHPAPVLDMGIREAESAFLGWLVSSSIFLPFD